jgi:hypothetical protein
LRSAPWAPLAIPATLLAAVVAQDRNDVADHGAEHGGDQEHQDERSVELAEEEFHTDLLRVLDDDDRQQDDGDAQRPMAPARALGRNGLPLSRWVCHSKEATRMRPV